MRSISKSSSTRSFPPVLPFVRASCESANHLVAGSKCGLRVRLLYPCKSSCRSFHQHDCTASLMATSPLTFECLRDKCSKAGQQHLLADWETVTSAEQQQLAQDIQVTGLSSAPDQLHAQQHLLRPHEDVFIHPNSIADPGS